jgi:DNA mismatch endonuclease, patch repair protein
MPESWDASAGRVPVYRGRFAPASETASRTKRRNRREGGRAEKLLRSILWRRGYRFRKHVVNLPGVPDLVFLRARVCIFCDGDFWHGRDWPTLRAKLVLRANPDYWIPKIERNTVRDSEQMHALDVLGWVTVRVWETDVLRDPYSVADCIANIIRDRILQVDRL